MNKQYLEKSMMKQYLEEREIELLNNFAKAHFNGIEYNKLSPSNKDIVVNEIHVQVLSSKPQLPFHEG